MAFKKGDKVTCSAEYTYGGGTRLSSYVRSNVFEVIQVGGGSLPADRVVIGKDGVVIAAVPADTLSLVGGTKSTPTTPQVPPAQPEVASPVESNITSEGIEEAMSAFITSGNTDDILKYNMRLLGVPHQFTHYCDYRTYSVANREPYLLIGRKFIENIFLEAPVVSIIPGKPLYLPASKNKKGMAHALWSAANNNLSELLTLIDEDKLHEKLRYYDFQQDYFKYMEYVNVLCSTAAAFLDLQNYTIPSPKGEEPIIGYQWQNYRWNTDLGYSKAASNMLSASLDNAKNFANALLTYGENAVEEVQQNGVGGIVNKVKDVIGGINTNGLKNMFEKEKETDEALLETLESVMTTINFVQFYVDPKNGTNEDNTNQTTNSAIESAFNTGEDYAREVAFLANSGGINASELQSLVDGGMDELNSRLTANANALGSIMNRMFSSASNIIKGEKMIFPKIYQRSDYNKSHQMVLDLRTPYGNRLSYFLNVLVPLFHILALAIPKQGTANTYASPFLVKAYFPGMWSCNLGIIRSIQIDKDPDGDSFTVDGYPSSIRVTVDIEDLYSEMSISSTKDVVLFLSNSSLIEYISTSCGVNLITPQLTERAKAITSVLGSAIESIPGTVENVVFDGLENLIMSLTGV